MFDASFIVLILISWFNLLSRIPTDEDSNEEESDDEHSDEE
jgi:hypothetical protein